MSKQGKKCLLESIITQISSLYVLCPIGLNLSHDWMPQIKLGNICKKNIWRIINTCQSSDSFGVKKWLAFCTWTLSVPQSSQSSTSYAHGKPIASQNKLCPQTKLGILLCQLEAVYHMMIINILTFLYISHLLDVIE